MNKLTITEALAEIKTINKRLENKRAFVNSNFAGDSRLRDPYAKEGGWSAKLESEIQSIGDLEGRLVKIRSAIHKANSATNLTISDHTMSVADWLVWRREVAPGQRVFYKGLMSGLNNAQKHKFEPGEEASVNLYVDTDKVYQKVQFIEDALGELDGKLSLVNATTFVEL